MDCKRAIRKFLMAVAVNWSVTATEEKFKLWEARFQDFDLTQLNAALSHCLDHCNVVPQFADVLRILQKGESVDMGVSAEQMWQWALKALQWSPELRAKSKTVLEQEKVQRCLLAAGGEDYVESCPASDLEWAHRRFIDAWKILSEMEENPHYLPQGEAREMLERIRKGIAALPPGGEA